MPLDASTMTRDDIVREFAGLQAEQARLATDNQDLRTNLQEKTEAVTRLTQRLQEIEANPVRGEVQSSDADCIRAYVFDASEEMVKRSSKSYRNAEGHGAVRLTHHANGKRDAFGLLDDPNPKSDWQRELQIKVGDRQLLRAISGNSSTVKGTELDAEIRMHVAKGPKAFQRIFSDQTGFGAEWIPDVWMAEVGRLVKTVPGNILDNIPQIDVPPGGTIHMPFDTSAMRPYKGAIPTINDPGDVELSNFATSERQFSAYKLVVGTQYDPDAESDSVIAMLPELRGALARALAFGEQDVAINGDTAGTQDDLANWNTRSLWGAVDAGSNDHRRGADGWRELAGDKSTTYDSGSAQTYTGYLAHIAKLEHPYYFGGLVSFVSPEYMLLKIMPAWTEFQGIDKVGTALATQVNGALGVVAGVPLVMTSFVTADLNASGVFDNATKTKTGIVTVARDRFRRGVRADVMIETTRLPRKQVTEIVASTRRAFFEIDPAASLVKNVAYAYNLNGQ